MESKQVKQRYQKIEQIGQGTYGTVYQAKDVMSNQIVALQQIQIDNEDEGIPSTALREITILKTLNHPNIVKLLDVNYQAFDHKLYLIFEYIDQDLRTHIGSFKNQTGMMSPYLIKSYMYQILQGMNYCHQRRIFHRDLKPQNILVNKQGVIQIADFGLARAFSVPIKTLTHEVETLWYRAPEILLGVQQYSLPVDVWSIGCILGELFEMKPILRGDSEIDQIFKIFNFSGTPTDVEWPGITALPDYKSSFPKFRPMKIENFIKNFASDQEGLDLFKNLMTLNPIDRYSVKQALNHKYFAGIDISSFKTLK